MRKRVHVFYAGRVQGVGFRFTVRELACGYEVTGFVRNLVDGRVELVAEGAESELRDFLEAIQSSQLASHIRTADVNWEPATGQFRQFEIAR
jgi:acylphosphatase